jgi:hypothetical protein
LLEEIEPAEVKVKERGYPLAHREPDEDPPVKGSGRERGQLALPGLIEVRARPQKDQARLGAGHGTRAHDAYDVVLVRCPLPKLFRAVVLQAPVVARQQVVVSAPKMLLGSSVGFS